MDRISRRWNHSLPATGRYTSSSSLTPPEFAPLISKSASEVSQSDFLPWLQSRSLITDLKIFGTTPPRIWTASEAKAKVKPSLLACVRCILIVDVTLSN
uniref:Uncharacterized protein n=1 Tax=Fagus sylvatica TaxID=28930 RepID=A0A2N9GAP3_FAGSY